MRIARTPRFWLLLWLGAGALVLVYVISAASVQTGERPAAQAKPAAAHALSASLLTGEMARFQPSAERRPAPNTVFELDGRAVSLSAFRGRTVLVNFWATWCAPCLKELPSLDALQGELGGDRFSVVAVASDPKGPDAARAFMDRLGIANLDTFADPKLQLVIAMGGQASLPLSVLYSAEGEELGRLLGEADWNSPEAKALIRAAMETP